MFSIMQPKADQTEKCFFIYEKKLQVARGYILI